MKTDKRKKRECDAATSPQELVRSFVSYCGDCDCPMGCIHRRGDVSKLLDSDSWQCASILQCFAKFALSEKA